MFNKNKMPSHRGQKTKKVHGGGTNSTINKGFSLIELVIIIAILAILIAVLAPSLMTYTERSRAQKDVTTMDEVVNAVQLAMADQKCYDEMIRYSCNNNFITYTDSSGNYGQQINDSEFWAPDGAGRATTITFNPEKGSNGDTVYRLENALVNDMTYGNGSVAENRVMQGAQIDNNQCYLKNASLNGSESTGYLYNAVRQSLGDDVITTSATYANSSFTVFIKFNQKDGITVADVEGAFNGTNLSPDSEASKGAGVESYDTTTGNPIISVTTPGKTTATFDSSALQGGGIFSGSTDYREKDKISISEGELIPVGGVYYVGINRGGRMAGDYSGYKEKYEAGEPFPKCRPGDVFVYGDYEYQFKYYYISSGFIAHDRIGWSARVRDVNKDSYGPLLGTINGETLTTLSLTYYGCVNLTKAPVIPNGVTTMSYVYSQSKLIEAPDLPDSVIDAQSAFAGLQYLKKGPEYVSKNLTNAVAMFRSCSSMEIAPDFSQCKNLTSLHTTFYGCSKLSGYIGNENANGDFSNYVIPENTSDMFETFAYCTSLTGAPKIPNKVTNMGGTFTITKITAAPIIPSSVKNMKGTFSNCGKLTGEITINANPSDFSQCFTNVNFKTLNLHLNGSSTLLDEIGSTGVNYCTECNGKCIGYHSQD